MKRIGLAVLIYSLWASTAFAEGKAAFVLCRNKKTVRTIRVEKKNQEFQTIYTKSGVDKTVGQASGYLSAFTIMKNIEANLKGAGWSCADIEKFEVTRSAAAE